MVEFLTLFLGLTAGVHPVAFAVSGPVAQVEIWLDGQAVGVVAQPPWTLSVDFGAALLPHELVAVARDAAGKVVAESRQRVNLPRSPAELRLALDTSPHGPPESVRLSWESLSGAAPSRVDVALDGEPLAVDANLRARLPRLDPRRLHFLSAELEFPDHNLARAELTFGGSYGAEVKSELTAIPLAVPANFKDPTLAEVAGWLRQGGRTLPVVAIDRGPADVVVVRDPSADLLLAKLRRDGQQVRIPALSGRFVPRPAQRDPEHMRFEMKLDAADRVRFLWPVAERVAHPRFPLTLFATSPIYTAEAGGMHWLLTRAVAPRALPPQLPDPKTASAWTHQLADAVAVAGLRAAAGKSRRAVVLVLGAKPEDASFHRPAAVRGYLRALGVPFLLWAEHRPKPDSWSAEWGPGEPINSLDHLQRAVRNLRESLDQQLVVWVEGDVLLRDVALTAPEGVFLLADPASSGSGRIGR